MLYLLGGFVLLCGLLLLGWLFVNADPARLARFANGAGIVLAVAGGAGAVGLGTAGDAARRSPPACCRCCGGCARRSAACAVPPPATAPTVETPFIRMSLDHDTGSMAGTVLQGRFAGMRLDELGRADLLALLRECRTADEEGARLVEAYLDRTDPDWRDDLHGEQAGRAPPAARRRPMSRSRRPMRSSGCQPGADAEAIKAAHHRLMKQLHPDHGGTDYFAAKINRARDVLLHR